MSPACNAMREALQAGRRLIDGQSVESFAEDVERHLAKVKMESLH